MRLLENLRRFCALTAHTVRVLAADPLMLIINLTLIALVGIMPRFPVFSFGQQVRLIREQSLAALLLVLLLFIVLAVARSVSDDLRSGSAGLIFSRPVGSFIYLASRWVGISVAAAMILVPCAVAVMWGSRLTFYEFKVERLGSWVYLGAVLVPLLLIFLLNYLFRVRYVYWANIALLIVFPLAFFGLGYFGYEGTAEEAYWKLIDWRAATCAGYLFFGLVAFTALLTALGSLLRHTGIFVAAVIFLALGVVLPPLLTEMPAFMRMILTTCLPDWQLYWLAERVGELENEAFTTTAWYASISLRHMILCMGFAVGQSLIYLGVGSVILNRRERAVNR